MSGDLDDPVPGRRDASPAFLLEVLLTSPEDDIVLVPLGEEIPVATR